MQPKVIAVVNQKGGTGKTSTTMNLAGNVALRGLSCVVVDTDPQQNAFWWAGRAQDLPFEIVADTNPKNLSRIRTLKFDYTFIDTPGSLEGEDVLASVAKIADFLILPAIPEPLGMAPLVRTIKQLVIPKKKRYRVLLNKVDPRPYGLAQVEAARELLKSQGIDFLLSGIRSYKIHADAPLEGLVAAQYERNDRYTLAAKNDVARVVDEIFSIIGSR